jgi:O-antigen/teichoic acid export membrane protein
MVASRIKGLILLPILTKTLGPELYGVFALIVISITMLTPLCTLKLDFAIIRFLSHEQNYAKVSRGVISVFIFTSIVALIITTGVLLFSQVIASNLFGSIEYKPYLILASPLIFISSLNQVMREYFRAFERMNLYASLSVIQTICEIILTTYAIISGYGISGAIISLGIVRAIIWIVSLYFVTRNIDIVSPSLKTIQPYFGFSLPLLPIAIGHLLISIGDRYIIGIYLGAGDVGIYSASYSIAVLLAFFYAPIPIVLFPVITRLFESQQINELKIHLEYSQKIFLLFSIPSLFGLVTLSKPILYTLTSTDYVRGHAVIPIIALATILYSLSDINNQILTLFKKTKISALIHSASAIINILLNIIMVPIYGLSGAAIATLITFTIHLGIISNIGYVKMPYKIDYLFFTKSVGASALMATIVNRINPSGIIDIIITIIIAAVIYFTTLFIVRTFSKRELKFIMKLLRN